MEPIDAHYTPSELAIELVEIGAQYCSRSPSIVADFAAGQGGLLDVAAAKWSNARIVANDAHTPTSDRLRRARPSWSVTNSNFVDENSVNRSKLKLVTGSVDLALLNPPFSQRSGDLHTVSIEGNTVTCGLAAAFIARSLNFLKVGGTISSILPDGCLNAERDKEIWRLIHSYCEVRVEARNKRGAFPRAFPNTSIVSLTKRAAAKSPSHVDVGVGVASDLEIIRGWQQMHSARTSGGLLEYLPLIHTTHMIQGEVSLSQCFKAATSSFFQGPALLIPRVGRITAGKICLLSSRRRVALSDCVIGIPFSSAEAAKQARMRLVGAWGEVERCYRGTGAPYTTISSVRDLLRQLNIANRSENGSS